MRTCLGCGTPTRGTRCPPCNRANRAKWDNPQHRAERRTWEPRVATGTVDCWRCVQAHATDPRIHPDDDWQLGHRPGLPSHPEHRLCNERAGARGIA